MRQEEKLDQPLDGTWGSAISRGKVISKQGCEGRITVSAGRWDLIFPPAAPD